MALAQFIAEVLLRFRSFLSRSFEPFCRRFESSTFASLPSSPGQPRSLPLDPQSLGREGERRAAKFLKRQGLKLLARNFRPHNGGEVDLVLRVKNQPELVFVEVKTRSSESFAAPHQAVDAQKRRGIILAAEEWLRLLNQTDVIVRFDIVEVLASSTGWQIRHLQNAFLAPDTLHPGSLFEDIKTHRPSAPPFSPFPRHHPH